MSVETQRLLAGLEPEDEGPSGKSKRKRKKEEDRYGDVVAEANSNHRRGSIEAFGWCVQACMGAGQQEAAKLIALEGIRRYQVDMEKELEARNLDPSLVE